MESFVFAIFSFMFWIPALLILILGLVFYKKVKARKILLWSSGVLFTVPFLIIISSRVDQVKKINDFIGTYSGQDENSNTIFVEIKPNEEFKIYSDNCDSCNVTGSWQYVREYEDFIFNYDKENISLSKDYDGILHIQSNFETSCCDLENVFLTKL